MAGLIWRVIVVSGNRFQQHTYKQQMSQTRSQISIYPFHLFGAARDSYHMTLGHIFIKKKTLASPTPTTTLVKVKDKPL